MVAREAQEFNTCMAEAGYPDFSSPPMSVASSMGEVVPLDGTVDYVLREASSQDPGDGSSYLGDYVDLHGLQGDALTVFSQAFLACDDARVTSRVSDSDSVRGAANAVMSQALRDLHDSPEYVTALRDYVACMRGDGWDVQDNGYAAGSILSAMADAAVEPGTGEGPSGLAGAVLDPALVEQAEAVQAQLVASDARCGADTLDPVYVPFNETYGALAAALYGVRPDGTNRVRL